MRNAMSGRSSKREEKIQRKKSWDGRWYRSFGQCVKANFERGVQDGI
jgi:hypothetical protein